MIELLLAFIEAGELAMIVLPTEGIAGISDMGMDSVESIGTACTGVTERAGGGGLGVAASLPSATPMACTIGEGMDTISAS